MIPIGTISQQGAIQQVEPFIYGISGHPLNRQEYAANISTVQNAITYDQQVGLLQGIGAQVYRMDVKTNSQGVATNHAKFVDIVGKCNAVGIKVLPMVYDNINYSLTPAENYSIGFSTMAGFVTTYGSIVDYVEFGNEIELFDNLKTGPGNVIGDWVPGAIDQVAQYHKGCYDGVRSVSSTIITLTEGAAGWFPTLLFDEIFTVAPDIDFLSWHIYSGMTNGYQNNFGISNILTYLYDRWGKKIWITETNGIPRESDTQQVNEARQLSWRQEFFPYCYNHPACVAYIDHELLDLPSRRLANWEESMYGIYKFPGITGEMVETTPKPPGVDYQGELTPKAYATYLINQNG